MRVREPVGESHFVRHVEPDPSRVALADEGGQVTPFVVDIVGAARLPVVIGDA